MTVDFVYEQACKAFTSGENKDIHVSNRTLTNLIIPFDKEFDIRVFTETGAMYWEPKIKRLVKLLFHQIELSTDQKENIALLSQAYYNLYLKE